MKEAQAAIAAALLLECPYCLAPSEFPCVKSLRPYKTLTRPHPQRLALVASVPGPLVCRVPSVEEQAAFARDFPQHVAPMPTEALTAAGANDETATPAPRKWANQPTCIICWAQPGEPCTDKRGRAIAAPHRGGQRA